MQLRLTNFGGATDYTINLDAGDVVSLPNGGGKTTIINAYIFALSGKTIDGFKPRNVNAPTDAPCEVTLRYSATLEIRRTLTAKGTTLYVGKDVVTQSTFEEAFPVSVAVACANVNVLTNPDLTSEQLRKLLNVSGAIDSDVANNLRKTRKAVEQLRKNAEQYALTNIVVPARTVEDVTASEMVFKREFEECNHVMLQDIQRVCPTCGAKRDPETIEEAKRAQREAKLYVDAYRDEYVRVLSKMQDYKDETRKIKDAERLIEAARKAREDVARYAEEIKRIDEEIRQADEAAIRSELPKHVAIQTESVAKNGRTINTCALTYKGIPLKSVNRATRIKVCIELLDHARKAFDEYNIPILVDNAESVGDWSDVSNNVIRFVVCG